jgi:hypothetical protein
MHYVCCRTIVDDWSSRLLHSKQDTQASIESYHGDLKHWFSFETKGLKRCHIDWLVWRLTITIAQHYMHTIEMKK